MRFYILLLTLFISVSCREKYEVVTTLPNRIVSIESKSVEHDNSLWTEFTISQKLNKSSPSYITGIQYNSNTEDLRWALVQQEISKDSVVTRIRVKPSNTDQVITLDRQDFEWFPDVQGLEPITIQQIKSAEQDAAPNHFPAGESDQ